jgi:hypothetical protein
VVRKQGVLSKGLGAVDVEGAETTALRAVV